MKKSVKYEKETEKWISNKMKKSGGAYSVNGLGLWHIDYIYGISSAKVALYNIILFFKFITRQFRKD